MDHLTGLLSWQIFTQDTMNVTMNSSLPELDSDCTYTFLSTDPYLISHFYQDYNRLIITIVIPIVVIFGFVGNVSFLLVPCRLKDMRTMTNFYLSNLAIADIGVLSAASVQYFWSYSYSAPLDVNLIGYTFQTPFGCLMPNLFNYTCYFASVWFITLVASERYLAICHPLKQIVISGKRRATRLVISVWLISILMASFSTSYAGLDTICIYGPSTGVFGDLPKKITRCTSLAIGDWCEYVLWIIDTVQFFVALICNVIMYARIIYTLSKTIKSNEHLSLEERTRKRNLDNRDNVAKMLLINALVFFFCLSPFIIINIQNISGQNLLPANLGIGLSWIGRLAYLLNSAVNPYIFSGVNRKYRQAFKRVFRSRNYNDQYSNFGSRKVKDISVFSDSLGKSIHGCHNTKL